MRFSSKYAIRAYEINDSAYCENVAEQSYADTIGL
jgi:hypothetical protein